MQFVESDRARPIVKWAGGKSHLLSQLIPLCPKKFERYFEPFMGGAALFLSLSTKVPAFLNDANAELVELYEVIRDRPLELVKSLERMRSLYSQEYFYRLRRQKPRGVVNRAARTIFLNKTGYNGLYRQNSRGEFNVPFGHRIKCPTLLDVENLRSVSLRLKRARLYQLDFEPFLRKAKKGDFVYCDPPYAPLSRTSSFNSYTSRGFNHDEQVRLLRACELAVARGAKVMVSNSSSAAIQDLYRDWDVRLIKARRAINSNPHRRGEVSEVLVLMGFN